MFYSFNVKCAECNELVNVFYSTREDAKEIKCKCGKLKCYPDLKGCKIDDDSRIIILSDCEENYIREFYSEDYLELNDYEKELLDKILYNKEDCEEFGYDIDKEFIGLYLNLEDDFEQIINIEFEIVLKADKWSPDKAETQHLRIKEGLERFLDLLIKLKEGVLDFGDGENLTKENWEIYKKKQINKYTFLC